MPRTATRTLHHLVTLLARRISISCVTYYTDEADSLGKWETCIPEDKNRTDDTLGNEHERNSRDAIVRRMERTWLVLAMAN